MSTDASLPTPRTDAAMFPATNGYEPITVVPVGLARQLEREAARLREALSAFIADGDVLARELDLTNGKVFVRGDMRSVGREVGRLVEAARAALGAQP